MINFEKDPSDLTMQWFVLKDYLAEVTNRTELNRGMFPGTVIPYCVSLLLMVLMEHLTCNCFVLSNKWINLHQGAGSFCLWLSAHVADDCSKNMLNLNS